jgi:predicted nucleotidyltransferase component of viral defense system
MLQYTAVDAPTLELLTQLMGEPAFSGLRLVGGTSLALQIGHRRSIDIDLFGRMENDVYSISQKLSNFGSVSLLNQTENIHIYLVNGIKVDLVNYPYPWLEDTITIDGLRLAGFKDIAAMKLAAITGRGTRKDFIDLFFLLKQYTLREMMSFYEHKYSDGSPFLVLKSLTYFDDADRDQTPVMLQPVNWQEIKKTIISSVREFLV